MKDLMRDAKDILKASMQGFKTSCMARVAQGVSHKDVFVPPPTAFCMSEASRELRVLSLAPYPQRLHRTVLEGWAADRKATKVALVAVMEDAAEHDLFIGMYVVCKDGTRKLLATRFYRDEDGCPVFDDQGVLELEPGSIKFEPMEDLWGAGPEMQNAG